MWDRDRSLPVVLVVHVYVSQRSPRTPIVLLKPRRCRINKWGFFTRVIVTLCVQKTSLQTTVVRKTHKTVSVQNVPIVHKPMVVPKTTIVPTTGFPHTTGIIFNFALVFSTGCVHTNGIVHRVPIVRRIWTIDGRIPANGTVHKTLTFHATTFIRIWIISLIEDIVNSLSYKITIKTKAEKRKLKLVIDLKMEKRLCDHHCLEKVFFELRRLLKKLFCFHSVSDY